ncbi:MAG TPA: glycosyltransferase family 4 protein [Verrucomicrobiae bacterium]|nr:glycosyltransferase family 4 protein [Verrucomicrobiae bacterium]
MKITHVITRLIVGGAQENTVATVLGLRQKADVEVHLISGPTTGSEGSLESKLVESRESKVEDNRSGSRPSTLGPRLLIVPELVRPIHPLNDWLALHRLEKIFREQKPDIVHTHSGKAGILGRLAARRAGVPIVIHTIHGPSFGNFQSGLGNFIFRAAEKKAARVTDHFIVVAEAMKTQYLTVGIGRAEQYIKIFSGFPLEPFLAVKNDLDLRKKLGIAPDDFVVGTIARLVKLKGHNDLFAVAPELVRQNPKIKFLLVGDGEYRARFENLGRSLKLERHFIFTGLVPPNEVPKYVGIMDALVHLSLREGLPRALPQALAAAKPVVAYDCDGAREVCLDSQTGFLIQPGDLKNLTEKIIHLANDSTLRQAFGRCGQNFVRENFAVEKMVESIHNLYLKLAARRGINL